MTEEKFLKISIGDKGMRIENNLESFDKTLELLGVFMAWMSKQRKGITDATSPQAMLAQFMHRIHEHWQKNMQLVDKEIDPFAIHV